ncbi:MAG: cation transporter [Stellaceae bacterium]
MTSAPDRRTEIADDPARRALVRRALRLEAAALAWLAIEAGVATWSGIMAASVSLSAFGFDSVIELASAGVLMWRLDRELRRGATVAEGAERLARRLAGGLLLVLAAYILIAAGGKLAAGEGQAFSWSGLGIAAASMPVMYLLARRKIAVADALKSRALRADAAESLTCIWLSLVVVGGLAIQRLTGAWWVDAVTSLGILWFVVREGIEAWHDEDEDAESDDRDLA